MPEGTTTSLRNPAMEKNVTIYDELSAITTPQTAHEQSSTAPNRYSLPPVVAFYSYYRFLGMRESTIMGADVKAKRGVDPNQPEIPLTFKKHTAKSLQLFTGPLIRLFKT
ncbi:hypothetical protein NPIL_255811 [Nephila pilipes]|uniref:Uncharacterized protein n=1 Tax=Nephila pilipes TaxID=299642 RepID=A0A8X6U3F9_NEPPI|nr:hypothetical protein NPIL_255811 [Nephila pilipes]